MKNGYLFVGGPADGLHRFADDLGSATATYQGETYIRTVMWEVTFFVHEPMKTWTNRQLLTHIFNCYSPPKDDDFIEKKPLKDPKNWKPKIYESKEISKVQELIKNECAVISEMLISKNKSYGNSALDPKKIFSDLEWDERIKVRIDDKLSRIMQGHEYPNDDTVLDLIGYLILYRIGKKMQSYYSNKETV